MTGGGRYRARHTEECRKRFETLLSGTDQGKKRFEAATGRVMKAAETKGGREDVKEVKEMDSEGEGGSKKDEEDVKRRKHRER